MKTIAQGSNTSQRRPRKTALLAPVAALTMILAGCADDSGGGDADQASSADTAEVTYPDANGECAVEPHEDIDFDTASTLIEEFEAETTSLPVTEALPETIDPETTVSFLDNGTAVAAIMWSALQDAAATAGVQLQQVPTGQDAQSINSAVTSVVESAPDILISAAVDATFYQNQLEALEEVGTTVVYAGSSNAEDFGLLDSHSGFAASQVNGEVLAAGAVAFTCGTGTDFVFYGVPELSFSQVQLDAATEYLDQVCASCSLRVMDIPIATMDTTAGDAVISDLQANPDTDFFITPADQIQIGLGASMDLAGIEVPGMGHSTLPPNVEQIGNGLQTAGFAVDYVAYSWFLLDEGLRRDQGVDVVYEDWNEQVKAISRVITETNAGEYPEGFVAYPELEQDFAALWGAQ